MTTVSTPLPMPLKLPGGLRVAAARAVLTEVARRVPVDVRLPDGHLLVPRRADEDRPVLELVRPDAFLRRIYAHPKIGIGEGYMAGEWRAAEGTDLARVLLPFAERLTTAVPPVLARWRRLVDRPDPSRPTQHTRGVPAQRRGALRPQQRSLRGVPGRNHELQLRALR